MSSVFMCRRFLVGIVIGLAASAIFAGPEKTVEVDAMKPFPVLRPVPERLRDERRGFQSAPSLTVSPKGRLWAAWHTGDTTEGDENGMVVVSSGDGGATWLGGLVLDERDKVSYPDAAEGPDGFIHVVHDRERTKAREILHHRFTEADVRAGRLVTPGSRLKAIVNKAGPKAK